MNTMNTVKSILQTELHLSPRETAGIVPATKIIELGADSLDYAGIISEVGEQFDIEVRDMDAEFHTVGELVQFIEKECAK